MAVVSLLVLVIIGALGGLVFARVFGAVAARNENRPGGGSEDEWDLMSHDEPARRARKRVTQSLGWALAAFGILLAAVGAASSFDEVCMSDAVPLAFSGTVLGVAAYMFGARRMGASAAVFSVVALIFLVGVSQGVLPGVERTNRNLPANEPNAQRPSGVDQRPPRPGAASVSHQEAFALTVAVLALSPSLSG